MEIVHRIEINDKVHSKEDILAVLNYAYEAL